MFFFYFCNFHLFCSQLKQEKNLLTIRLTFRNLYVEKFQIYLNFFIDEKYCKKFNQSSTQNFKILYIHFYIFQGTIYSCVIFIFNNILCFFFINLTIINLFLNFRKKLLIKTIISFLNSRNLFYSMT